MDPEVIGQMIVIGLVGVYLLGRACGNWYDAWSDRRHVHWRNRIRWRNHD